MILIVSSHHNVTMCPTIERGVFVAVVLPEYEGMGCLYGREAARKIFGRKPHPLIKTRDWIIRSY